MELLTALRQFYMNPSDNDLYYQVRELLIDEPEICHFIFSDTLMQTYVSKYVYRVKVPKTLIAGAIPLAIKEVKNYLDLRYEKRNAVVEEIVSFIPEVIPDYAKEVYKDLVNSLYKLDRNCVIKHKNLIDLLDNNLVKCLR